MKTLEELIRELPPELRQEVADFVEFLLEKYRKKGKGQLQLDWRGALRDLRNQYTSAELQHRVPELWGD